jgi:hypothetical protein
MPVRRAAAAQGSRWAGKAASIRLLGHLLCGAKLGKWDFAGGIIA